MFCPKKLLQLLFCFIKNFTTSPNFMSCGALEVRMTTLGPQDMSVISSMGVFIKDPSPHSSEFRRKPRKTPNGYADILDRELNLASLVYQFKGQNRSATAGFKLCRIKLKFPECNFEKVYLQITKQKSFDNLKFCWLYNPEILKVDVKRQRTMSNVKQGSKLNKIS